MAEPIGLAASLLALLKPVLEGVRLVREAKEYCERAPLLTQKLVDCVASSGHVLSVINDTVVNYPPHEDVGDLDLMPILEKLTEVLAVAIDVVLTYSQKNAERDKKAAKVLEILKATCNRGAAKDKKVIEATLDQINSCQKNLNSIILSKTYQKVSEKGRAAERSLKLLAKLQMKAKFCEGNTRLYGIQVRRVGQDGKTLVTLESFELKPQSVNDQCHSSEESGGLRRRESGMLVHNSEEIKFTMSGNGGWFFYVVTCDLRNKTPELFFPENLQVHKNLLRKGSPRTFPNRSVFMHDPCGLKMDRSERTPPDGDSPWAIFIIITSKQVSPNGDVSETLLTIEDTAEVLDRNDTEVLVKEFLIDVVKQADVANGCSDRSLDSVRFESGSVAAHSPSMELPQAAPRNDILGRICFSLVALIVLLVAYMCLWLS